MNKIIEKFNELSRMAFIDLNKYHDCRRVEEIYIKILELIKRHPAERENIIKAMLLILETDNAPWEIIQFCMRELKWPEIRVHIMNLKVHPNDPRQLSVLNDILAVYNDRWNDEDLYLYYSKNK